MATCTIGVSQITLGTAFNVSWSGQNYGNNSAKLSLFAFNSTPPTTPSGFDYAATIMIKSISTSASGNQNVTISASEYNSAVSTLGSYSYYRVALEYTSYDSNYDNWDNGISNYISVVATTACTAPTNFSLSAATSTGGNVTLSWSEAKAGTNNSITSYLIQRREHNGSTWGSWSNFQTVNSTATSGSVSVAPPTTVNYSYQYQIRTQGSAGSSYYSGWKTSTNNLKRVPGNCTAPQNCSLNATTSSGGNVTLSWSEAAGGSNNSINGYYVQRSLWNGSAWGSWENVGTVSSTATSASLSVAPPATVNQKYKYQVRTQGTAGSSYYSGWKASSNDLTRIPGNCVAPKSCSLDATTSTGGNVTLRWSEAASGSNNTINGYYVQRSLWNGSSWGAWENVGTVSSTATSATLAVAPPATVGNKYKYQVRTQGTAGSSYYSGWTASSNDLTKIATSCQAPTSFSLASSTSTGANVNLNWSGAESGANNAINGYLIQRRLWNGSTWGSWENVQTVSSTATTGLLSVAPPTTLNYEYQYQIRTQGAAGSSYYSGFVTSTNNLKRIATNCEAPTSCSLSATTSTGSNVTLNWSGASGGTLNAITGYNVQYREHDGTSWGSWTDYQTVSSTETSGSLSIAPPSAVNHQYQFRVRTQGAAGSTYYSDYTESTNTILHIVTLSTPSITMTSAKSNTCQYTITASTITGGTGTVTYTVERNDVTVDTTTTAGTAITIADSTVRSWGTSTGSFTVTGSVTINGYTATSAESASVPFTFRPNTISYFTGTSFVTVIPFVFVSTDSPTEVEVYRYNGTTWEEIGTV